MNANDDIINKIKNALHKHEESYDEGAWERFNAKKPRNTAILFIKWTSAVAAVLIGIVLFSRIFNPEQKNNSAATVEAKTKNTILIDSTSSNATHLTASQKFNDTAVINTPNKNHIPSPKILAANYPHTIKAIAQTAIVSPAQPPIIATTKLQAESQPTATPIVTENSAQKKEIDFWKNKSVENNPITETAKVTENNKPSVSKSWSNNDNKHSKDQPKKWQPGVYISPVFGELGVNMGYGFSLGYAINDKLKISSGVAHTKISATKSFSNPTGSITGLAIAPSATNVQSMALISSKNATAASSEFAAPSQQQTTLQQVDGFLSGIDIPIELNYSFNKKLYASAGVSGFVVLSDNRKYTYLDSRNIKISVETDKGSLIEDKSVAFSQQNTTVHSAENTPENKPIVGFYNLSVGFRQKITHSNSIAVEPFLKVPIQNATPQSLQYKGIGVRLKFDF